MESMFARQGDIGILHTKQTAERKKPVAPICGQLILGHGSATGHRHTVSSDDASLYEAGEDLLLVVHKDTKMLHPEHENKIIPAGAYLVRRQREWLQEEVKYVVD